jgi:hypothetical protein
MYGNSYNIENNIKYQKNKIVGPIKKGKKII